MSPTHVRVLFLAIVCAAAAPLVARGPASAGADVVASDRERIRSHLMAVEIRLRAADVSELRADQRARRDAALDHLREYWMAGVFPHNHGSAEPTPLFRDRHGTLCAMAYLIERSGHGELVDRVAAAANDAYVRELADDRGLRAWLESHGMTVAEAALVQPWYGPAPEPDESSWLTRNYDAVGGALLAADALAIYLARPTRTDVGSARAIFSLGTGVASALTGFLVLDEGASRGTRAIAGANLLLGGIAGALGVVHLTAGPEAATLGSRLLPDGASLSARPALLGGELRPGVAFDLRF